MPKEETRRSKFLLSPLSHALLFLAIAISAISLSGLAACSSEETTQTSEDGSSQTTGGRLRLATTTSLYDTGLWDFLEPMFEDIYGVELDIITGGTGQALEYGKRGDVDVLTLHDRPREEEFIAQGYGIQRYPIAYNYFFIVGPEGDPAGIEGLEPERAFREIMRQGQINPDKIRFVSRGDRSGTHAREMLLWRMAGQDYESVRNSGEWYIEAGAGMGAILTMADEKSAYTLTVNGTYLAFKEKLNLVSLVDRGESLLNVYSVIAINPEKHPDTNADMADKLIQFLASEEVQDFIESYGLSEYGTPLFIPARGQEPR
jgi:tungstate transport system substrate-binding protein